MRAIRKPVTGATPAPASRAATALAEARACDRAGDLGDAIERYTAAAALAEQDGASAIAAEALRRLAEAQYKRGELQTAIVLCERSEDTARQANDDVLIAEALNTMGCLQIASGSLDAARDFFLEALRLGGPARPLRARAQQNLGILANIRGAMDEALAWYGRSLEEYRAASDEHGCALAYNNLGMASADRGLYDEADRYFSQSGAIAERAGDWHLVGLAFSNHAEVHAARQRYDDALVCAEEALRVFERIGARGAKSDAYRVIGMVYRDTGRHLLAESRLRSAIAASISVGSVLGEAEASRELAILYQTLGRNQEALALLFTAHRQFGQLDARVDLVNVDGKMAALQATYLAVVREWGASIESSDSYTFGHCERVAENAATVAAALGLDAQEVITVRLGAYLHDVGKVRVAHEILNKPGPLSADEAEQMRRHPEWGVELLAGVEFPWAITPIIRSHHEKYDGSGYPDRLRGDEIPLTAQIVGVADVYDALTSTRSYRAAMSHDTAMEEIRRCVGWWSPRVHAAALQVFGVQAPVRAGTPPRDRVAA